MYSDDFFSGALVILVLGYCCAGHACFVGSNPTPHVELITSKRCPIGGIAIGGDRWPGVRFLDVLLRFEADPNIKMILGVSCVIPSLYRLIPFLTSNYVFVSS